MESKLLAPGLKGDFEIVWEDGISFVYKYCVRRVVAPL